MPLNPRFYRDFHYDRRLLPSHLAARLEEGVSTIDEAREKTGYTVGYPGWNLLYYSCYCALHDTAGNVVIETGANWGISTVFLAQALEDRRRAGHVHTMEIDPANVAKARRNFAEAGLEHRITLHEGDSLVVLPELLRQTGPVRFAFLDGNHQREHVVREFEIVHAHLEKGSLVFFDNVADIGQPAHDQRVFGALQDIQARFGGNVVRFPFTSWYTPGQAIWQA